MVAATGVVVPRGAMREFAREELLPAFLAIVCAVAVWAVATVFVHPAWLPTPQRVASKTGSLLGDKAFVSALIWSVGQMLLGFAIALALGTAAGVAVALSKRANFALTPYINLVLIVPSVALAPVLLVIFGTSRTNVLVLVVIFAIGLVAVNTSGAVRGMDRTLVEVGQVYGAKRASLIRTIILPSVLPNFFTGLHLGITRAFKGMLVGQEILGVIGLGAYEAEFQDTFDSAGIWSLALILILVALIFTWIVRALDYWLNSWAYR